MPAGRPRAGSDPGPAGFGDALPSAERLFRRWEERLGDDTDLSTRFWSRYYAGGFEGMGGVDLRWCTPLAEPHHERCLQAGAEVYARDLAPLLEREGVDLCAISAPDATALLPWIPTVPHERLDQIVRARHEAACRP